MTDLERINRAEALGYIDAGRAEALRYRAALLAGERVLETLASARRGVTLTVHGPILQAPHLDVLATTDPHQR